MEELMKEILQELKRHTSQNDRIIVLLERLRPPSGQSADVTSMMTLLKTMLQKSKNPAMGDVLNQMEEMVKKQGA